MPELFRGTYVAEESGDVRSCRWVTTDAGRPDVSPAVRIAGDFAGYVQLVKDRELETTPRMKYSEVARVLASTGRSDDETLANMVASWPDVDWQREYMSNFKLVAVGDDGQTEAVQRYPGLDPVALGEMGEAAEIALRVYDQLDEDCQEASVQRKLRRAKAQQQGGKRYTLAQFIHDYSVREKFELSPEFMQLVIRYACSNAVRASGVLQRYIREKTGDKTLCVEPGDYAQGGKAAKRWLMRAAAACGPGTVGYDALVVGDRLVVDGPKRADGLAEWTVSGPLTAGDVVDAVVRMVTTQGPTNVTTLLGVQLVRVGIEVFTPEFAVVGEPVAHVGVEPVVRQQKAPCRGRFPGYEDVLVPVEVAGGVCATAMRVSGTSAYVPTHVLTQHGVGAVSVLGSPVVEEAKVASDISLVGHSPVPMVNVALHSRAAVKNEAVEILFVVGDGGLEVSGVTNVSSVEGGSIVMRRPGGVRKGCSGGAIVALSDGALLGTYYGSTSNTSIGHPVRLEGSLGVRPAAARTTVPVDGNRLFEDFLVRGLADRVRVLAERLEPLMVDGCHVATGVRVAQGIATTIDPMAWPLKFHDGVVCSEVGDAVDGVHWLRGRAPLGEGELKRRDVEEGEQITFVGKDANGDVFMSVPVLVKTIRRGAGGFYTAAPGHSAYEMAGAVAVAISDAAVVGVYERGVDAHGGRLVKVLSLGDVDDSARFVDKLAEAASGLSVDAWRPDVVECLREGEGAEFVQYAAVGGELLDEVVPHAGRVRRGTRAWTVGESLLRESGRWAGGGDADDVEYAFSAFVGAAVAFEDEDRLRSYVEAAWSQSTVRPTSQFIMRSGADGEIGGFAPVRRSSSAGPSTSSFG